MFLSGHRPKTLAVHCEKKTECANPAELQFSSSPSCCGSMVSAWERGDLFADLNIHALVAVSTNRAEIDLAASLYVFIFEMPCPNGAPGWRKTMAGSRGSGPELKVDRWNAGVALFVVLTGVRRGVGWVGCWCLLKFDLVNYCCDVSSEVKIAGFLLSLRILKLLVYLEQHTNIGTQRQKNKPFVASNLTIIQPRYVQSEPPSTTD